MRVLQKVNDSNDTVSTCNNAVITEITDQNTDHHPLQTTMLAVPFLFVICKQVM